MTRKKNNFLSALERLVPNRFRRSKPVVPVVRFFGAIGAVSPFRSGLTLAGCAGALERAFTMRGIEAVAIAVNSPGGSPVQSRLIHHRIRALSAEHEVPVYVFAEDVAASGGYILACAGDEIYADESSVIGSIGVISAGFGFAGAIARLGIERRVYTAGENKMILDPFQPEKEKDVERIRLLQLDLHESFKTLVRGRRGDLLTGEESEMFSGAFWPGRPALDLGLIDGIGDMRSVTRDKRGDGVELKVIHQQRGWLRRGLGADALVGDPAGPAELPWPSLAGDLLAVLEERALWSRYGL